MRFLPTLAAVAAVSMSAGGVMAAPQIEFHITGAYDVSATSNASLDYTSFGVSYTSGGSNGGLFISPEGTIDITRTEVFSDPDETSSPFIYNEVRTFTYYGLIESLDDTDNALPLQFFVATKPNTVAGQAFSDVFAGYLSDHPAITSLGDFIDIIRRGPDDPTPGGNAEWIDFNDRVMSGEWADLVMNIQTTFQTGEAADLVVFDNTSGIGSVFGNIAVQANNIPEPATLGLLLPALAYWQGRRRH